MAFNLNKLIFNTIFVNFLSFRKLNSINFNTGI